MQHTFIRQLRELIKKLILELSLNNLFIRDILDDQRNRVLEVEPINAMQLIKELEDSLYKIEYSENWPLLRIYIAFCYCILNDLHSARTWAEDAVRILNATNKEWNLAFGYWFLAAIYREDAYFKDAREQYINAQKIFYKIMINTLNNNVGYRLKKECSKRIDQVKFWISILSRERSRLFNSVRKEQKVNVPTDNHEPNTDETAENNRAGRVVSSSTHVNIHMPIDIENTDHIDQRFLQNTYVQQDQFSHQEQESTLGTTVPIDIDHLNTTNFPRIAAAKPSDEASSGDADKEGPIPINIPDLTYLLTPGLPIFGKASAGPEGEVVFDEPNYEGTVDESPTVQIEGKEYKLVSIKRDDNQVSISYDDFYKSLDSKNTNHEERGKRYGWLKVVGNSMNDARPIPIDNDDHVLFYENRSPRDGQIVIASLPTPDSLHMPLVVKRLKIMKHRIILRSESCDENVIYKDIEIPEEHLMGEVVAIAKLIANNSNKGG